MGMIMNMMKNTKIQIGAAGTVYISTVSLKCQLISKRLFVVFNFFQKSDKDKLTLGIIVVKLNSFVCFGTIVWKSKIIPDAKSKLHEKDFDNFP